MVVGQDLNYWCLLRILRTSTTSDPVWMGLLLLLYPLIYFVCLTCLLSCWEDYGVDAGEGGWAVTYETVVVPHPPPPHTLAVEDVAASQAGGGGRHQVLLADLTDRIQHDVVCSLRLCWWRDWNWWQGEDFCFYSSWSTESQITVVGQTWQDARPGTTQGSRTESEIIKVPRLRSPSNHTRFPKISSNQSLLIISIFSIEIISTFSISKRAGWPPRVGSRLREY